MDENSRRIFSQNFSLSPVLFLEISRIKCNASQYVLPQNVSKVDSVDISLHETLNEHFARFINGEIGVGELLNVTEKVEEVAVDLVNGKIRDIINALNLKIIPTAIFINRILSKGVFSPEIQFFVCKDVEKLKNLKKVERKVLEGKIEFGKGRERLIRMEGKMLGYPECCVESYVESKRTFPAESRFIMEGLEKGVFKEVIRAFMDSRILSVPQLFTSNFYPCSTECEKAKKVGLKLEEWLEDYSNAFRLRSMLITLFYAATGLKASKSSGSYAERLREHYNSLGSKEVEILDIFEKNLSNQTKFTNTFLSRVLSGFSK